MCGSFPKSERQRRRNGRYESRWSHGFRKRFLQARSLTRNAPSAACLPGPLEPRTRPDVERLVQFWASRAGHLVFVSLIDSDGSLSASLTAVLKPRKDEQQMRGTEQIVDQATTPPQHPHLPKLGGKRSTHRLSAKSASARRLFPDQLRKHSGICAAEYFYRRRGLYTCERRTSV